MKAGRSSGTLASKDKFAQSGRVQVETSTATAELPPVLRCLAQEHRHFAALLNALERKARQTTPLAAVDHYLMRDIVAYMHDYPAGVHHPTENLLFKRLLRRKPALNTGVKRVRGDHQAVAAETRQLLGMLDEAIARPGHSRDQALRRACRAFIGHQREHMQFENLELFPLAVETLTQTDWKDVESHFATVDDPLFGPIVGNKHRLLYEYMLGSPLKSAEEYAVSSLFSLERLILMFNSAEQGAGAYGKRLKRLFEEIAEETRVSLLQALKPGSLGAFIATPFGYTAFLAKAMLDCGSDLMRISTATARDILAPGNTTATGDRGAALTLGKARQAGG